MKKYLLVPFLLSGFLFLFTSAATRRPITGNRMPPKEIKALMRKVCDWQLAHLPAETVQGDGKTAVLPNDGWVRGAFFTGVMATYRTTGDNQYLNAAQSWAEGNAWKPGPRAGHADDHCVGQTYLELYAIRKEPQMIAPLRQTFDQLVANPQPGPVAGWSKSKNWSWCDALFMAPPALAAMSAATGEVKYLNYMNDRWWETYDYLYDPQEHLYYRDANYKIQPDGVGPRSKNGKKILWARGNGWVMGGLVRVLAYMPENDPKRRKYLQQYQEMAAKIASLQGSDGLWRTSLLDAEEFPNPETSSSGFFCYALAWGINQKILPREQYLPVVQKAWQGLAGCVDESGKLGWVQRIGHDPQEVTKEDTMEYGSGALLLAGSEVIKL